MVSFVFPLVLWLTAVAACGGVARSAGPAKIKVPGRVIDVGVGADATCTVDSDGRVACMGYNDFGQRGDAIEACRENLAPVVHAL
jgi:hypothetical protein